jgi:putative endonuclease
MMSNKSHTLYVGSTVDLAARVRQHKTPSNRKSFSGQYRFTRLVWCEAHTTLAEARRRETQLKGWRRQKKVALIQESNPNWDDLSRDWAGYLKLG